MVRDGPLRRRRRGSRRSPWTSPRRATRSRTSCSTTLIAALERGARRRRRALRRAHLDAREGLLRGRRTSAGFAADVPLVAQALRRPTASRGCSALIGELGKPTLCAANGHVLAGALGLALACDLIIAKRGRALRHARDQRRRLPVHDHGADLPQRRAQEDERAAAARRADRRRARRSGSGSSTRSSPAEEFDAAVADWAARLAAKSPRADAARQGRDVPPAGPGVRATRSSTCTRSSTLAFSTEDIQEGVKAFFEKREPVWTGRAERLGAALPHVGPHAGGARGAEALARALARERAPGRLARRAARRARYEDDLRDSRGCLLEAGGQVEDALDGRRASRCCSRRTARSA